MLKIFLFVINKSSKIRLYFTNFLLNLAINLKIKDYRQFLFNAKEITK